MKKLIIGVCLLVLISSCGGGKKKIDPRTLESVRSKKDVPETRENLIKKLAGLNGSINRFKGRYETTKDKTPEDKKKKQEYFDLWQKAEKEKAKVIPKLRKVLDEIEKLKKNKTVEVKKPKAKAKPKPKKNKEQMQLNKKLRADIPVLKREARQSKKRFNDLQKEANKLMKNIDKLIKPKPKAKPKPRKK
jgi:chromosome segregation ATPase